MYECNKQYEITGVKHDYKFAGYVFMPSDVDNYNVALVGLDGKVSGFIPYESIYRYCNDATIQERKLTRYYSIHYTFMYNKDSTTVDADVAAIKCVSDVTVPIYTSLGHFFQENSHLNIISAELGQYIEE